MHSINLTLFREYDPEIARWKSLDPKLKDFPSESPFSAMGNNPIMNTDVLGDWFKVINGNENKHPIFNSLDEGAFLVPATSFSTKHLENQLNNDFIPKWKKIAPAVAKHLINKEMQVGLAQNMKALGQWPADGVIVLNENAYRNGFIKDKNTTQDEIDRTLHSESIMFHESIHEMYGFNTEFLARSAQLAVGYLAPKDIKKTIENNNQYIRDGIQFLPILAERHVKNGRLIYSKQLIDDMKALGTYINNHGVYDDKDALNNFINNKIANDEKK